MAELSALKSQNEELRSLIQTFIPSLPLKHNAADSFKYGPIGLGRNANNFSIDYQYEFSRRKLITDVNEMWNFIRSSSESESPKSHMKDFVAELKNSLLYDLDVISKRDESIRRLHLEKLSSHMQQLISQLQNPSDCKNARKLVCTLDKGCGFGCQIHHLTYCMVVALATKRTLILNSRNWRYANKLNNNDNNGGAKSLWESAFKPLSETCLDDFGTSRTDWLKSHQHPNRDVQVLNLPILDALRPRPEYLPQAIPEEISSELITLHGAPFVWFIGQVIKYIWRPSNDIDDYLQHKKEHFGFKTPIVGVHVRRTDKINTEASFHWLSEYMVHVEDYYDRLDLFSQRQNSKPPERLIYLATDDINVWKKEVPVFEKKGYKFIGDSQISDSASIKKRYSFESLKNIMLDVWLLSETDYLVCTFSSQVCRLAYELMQSKNPGIDKSLSYYSLDDIYYFGGQNSHNQIAILDHKPTNNNDIESTKQPEIRLKRGDIVGIAGNHWNGYSKGLNRVTQQSGLYPGFKTKEKIETVRFEIFQNED